MHLAFLTDNPVLLTPHAPTLDTLSARFADELWRICQVRTRLRERYEFGFDEDSGAMITWAGHPVRRLGIVGRVLVIMPHENNRQRASRHDSLASGEVGVQDNYNRAKVSRGPTGIVP